MRDKAAWSEASRSNPEQLTVDEFLAFRHPESSHSTILTLVEELFDKFGEFGSAWWCQGQDSVLDFLNFLKTYLLLQIKMVIKYLLKMNFHTYKWKVMERFSARVREIDVPNLEKKLIKIRMGKQIAKNFW